MATTTRLTTCTLCEAMCGVVVETDGQRVVSIYGDDDDPFSKGYICPKAAALQDLHEDPDRLRRPLVREGNGFREATWDEALDRAATGIREVQRRHGRDAFGAYYGNPTAHDLGLVTMGIVFLRSLRTKNLYSASSTDQMPHMLAAREMFGLPFLLPVPDLDRTQHLLVLGANPLVSNGSIMSAPDVRGRLRALRERGGKLVVVDPRRTETAAAADEHLFIRPGTDALLVAAMLATLFEEGRIRPGRLEGMIEGQSELASFVARFPPERVSEPTGIPAPEIRRLARELASSDRSACYARVGICHQEHATIAAWLVYALSVVTGSLDREGGLMFTTPAVDLAPTAEMFGANGYARWRTRVRGLPEIAGELPAAALAEEIEHPGRGQVRGLVTLAGNPVLSTPNGARLERALASLEHMVSIDAYMNETTRHAHVILPPVSPLQRVHYNIVFNAFAVRNVAKYCPPVFERGPDDRDDAGICGELLIRTIADGWLGGIARRIAAPLLARGPEGLLDLTLRLGPQRLTLERLRRAPHGLDLGPLVPRLPAILRTPERRIRLATPLLLSQAEALTSELGKVARDPAELLLIGRRQLRSNNSWMHNSHRLVKGPRRCTLIMHSDDARARGLVDGSDVEVRSRVGRVTLPVEITDGIMPGVVSMPHGWGHSRPGVRMRVAEAHAGASINDLTDEERLDRLSGNAAYSGVPVRVDAV